jgi:broad specificity phosphatase PhoE
MDRQQPALFCPNKKIILARHGETLWNRDRLIMGRSNSELTLEGVSIAKKLARLIEKEDVQAVYSSPLGRAVSSAAIYTGSLGLPILPKHELAELSCGEWEGCSLRDVEPGRKAIRENWQDRPPEGESYQDSEARIGSFIRDICSNMYPERILVVSHAGAGRVFLKLWLGLEPELAIKVDFPHDTIFILGNNGGVVVRSTHGANTRILPMKSD